MKITITAGLLFIMSILNIFGLHAQTVLTDHNGVAVQGYDIVAYFTESKPVKGSSDITAAHDGVTYFFSTEEHKALFLENPETYLPAYGGYCAYAVAKGSTAPIQPRQWVVYEERLFLNFSSGTQRIFTADLAEMVARADRNWPGIESKLERRTSN